MSAAASAIWYGSREDTSATPLKVALAKLENPVRNSPRLGVIVRYPCDRAFRRLVVAPPRQKGLDVRCGVPVQGRGRFVEKQDRRIELKGPKERYQQPFAAGEALVILGEERFLATEAVEQ